MLLWMSVVFCLSFDFGSEVHTGRFIVPLLHWLDPHMSMHSIARIHLFMRKTWHVIEYAILVLLIIRTLRTVKAVPRGRWSWPIAMLSIAAATAYGASDEIHQLFVTSRGPSFHDVVIDAGGAALGALLAFAWSRRPVLRPAGVDA